MVREQLDASGGWVRCGHCMDVFDAKLQINPKNVWDDPAIQDAGSQPLSFEKKAAQAAFWQRPALRVALVVGCLFLIILLAAQILRTQRDRLTHVSPALGLAAAKLCQLWPCAPIGRLQIDGWVLDHSSFQKINANEFRLGLLLKNNSPSELLVPHLDVSLLDANDAVVIRKSIDLSTNLTGQMVTAASGEERRFDLALTPSIASAAIAGYRLVLFYP
jgi:hypothetical protein